ncbi:hypothetical protein Tco_0847747, partial [Tanacetum coccineum]
LLAGVHDDVVAVTFPVHARCQSDKVNRKSSTTCLQKQAYILRLLTSMVYNIVRCLESTKNIMEMAEIQCRVGHQFDERFYSMEHIFKLMRLDSTQNMMETTYVYVVFLTGQFTGLGLHLENLAGFVSNLSSLPDNFIDKILLGDSLG